MARRPPSRSVVFGYAPLSSAALVRMAVGAVIVLALGWVLGTAVNRVTPLPVEQEALAAVAELRTDWGTALMRGVSHLGHLDVVIPAMLLALPLLRWLTRAWEAAWLLSLAFVGSLAVTAVVKVSVGRERPLDALIDASSAAFPSGHSSRAAAMLGLGIWAVAAIVRRPAIRTVLVGLLLTAVLAMGWSRVYLGVHWPTDVLFGYALGAWWVFVLLHAVKPRVVPTAVVGDEEPQISGPPP